ncbi:hypothetical protein GQ54DRAFT_175231 [Martensiomyces pterosporus]|nr:hypothetical protein GQ54DRAFT_175231 [Martensiomyces pterosporus]
MGSNQSQTYSSTMMNTNYNISGSTSVQQQQQADSDIEALSRFLAASSSGNDPQQQPIVDVSVSDQAMAAFLAATTAGGSAVAYPDNSNFGISVQDSPLAIASIEITPSPSMQQPQFSDLSQDAALAAAGFAAAANGMATTPLLSPIASAMQGNSPLLAGNADMDSPLSSHSFSGFGSNALNSMLGGSGVPVHNSYSATGGLSLPQMSTSSSGFLLPPGSCGPGAYSTGSILGKRTSEEAGLPIIPVGVPLSKRVTMPASYGGNLGDGPTISSMPIPSGVSHSHWLVGEQLCSCPEW